MSRMIVTVKRGKKWANILDGNYRSSSTHLTQQDAIEVAKHRAQQKGYEHVIYRKDGTIREINKYLPLTIQQ
ncbi:MULTISPECIES: DUF2188 domain-containing protein [Bacillaceae]|uniref:DUF2188 domain-containing protein n=1 Tax=Bacillales TaxID=1385 RepID=UPI001C86D8A9|nr:MULTISPECIES: DUF2188 domain-containing protein [Bacillaceae]